MRIKVGVFHMEPFLNAVNECKGPVNLLSPNGRKFDINRNVPLQQDLRCEHQANQNYTRLNLDIPGVRDYFDLVLFAIGEC